MKKFIMKITCFIFIFPFFGNYAVGQDAEVDIESINESAFIWQMIDTELAEQVRDRIQSGNLTGGNVSQIVQVGNNNSATVNQQGNQNYSEVLQVGDYNESELLISGNRNFATVNQLGSFNKVTKTIQGNDTEFQLLQQGNGLNFSIQGDLPSGTRITQEGTGMRIQIK